MVEPKPENSPSKPLDLDNVWRQVREIMEFIRRREIEKSAREKEPKL